MCVCARKRLRVQECGSKRGKVCDLGRLSHKCIKTSRKSLPVGLQELRQAIEDQVFVESWSEVKEEKEKIERVES